jgi:hypothetical protein
MALEAELVARPPFGAMTEAELDAWWRDWPCGPKGPRLDALRRPAQTPAERRAGEEQAAVFAGMSTAELDGWLLVRARELSVRPDREPPVEQGC